MAACKHAGLTVVTQVFHQFGDGDHPGGGAGGIALCGAPWQELGAVTLDISVCNVNQDNGERAKTRYDTLHAAL